MNTETQNNERQAVKVTADSLNDEKRSIGSLRVGTAAYFGAFFVLSFASAFLLYLDHETSGFILLLLTWIIIPVLAATDRVRFDGKRLVRDGIAPRVWRILNRSRYWLRLSDIEQVDTQMVRSLRRGGRVMYRYSTTFRGKGTVITLTSGGESYRRLIKKLLPLIPTEVMDGRSLELRDYLLTLSDLRVKTKGNDLPSFDVLESSIRKRLLRRKNDIDGKSSDPEKASNLRRLANELRLAGSLPQSLEAFRRAAWPHRQTVGCSWSFPDACRLSQRSNVMTEFFGALRR